MRYCDLDIIITKNGYMQTTNYFLAHTIKILTFENFYKFDDEDGKKYSFKWNETVKEALTLIRESRNKYR